MKKFEIWGNKKNIESIKGKIYLSEEREREFIESGIIKESGIIEDEKGNRIPYYKESGKESRIYQYHSERKNSYKIISERINNINYRMILFPKKEFLRIEIWKFPKGEKREMIYRNDKEDYKEISKEWKKISGKEIDIEKEIEKII